MFRKLKNRCKESKAVILMSPIEGEAVQISEVSDPTFGEEILGKGFAIHPVVGRVVAPFDGEITLLFETAHALTMTSTDGVELLIHVGLETVGLQGSPFQAFVSTGDKVRVGTKLLEFDMNVIKEAGCELITPIVITNSEAYTEIAQIGMGYVKELNEVMKISK
ncbi:MAG: PTS glucose transporter subunit IIA [Lachnospiraceae bacterium]|nr:PTS glucose transporter subunit IIA [Lachnospiraceae bacterium]